MKAYSLIAAAALFAASVGCSGAATTQPLVSVKAQAPAVSIQEYWSDSTPRYWIANSGTAPVTISAQGEGVAPTVKLLSKLPAAALGKVEPNSVIDVDATSYLSNKATQFYLDDGSLIATKNAPAISPYLTTGLPIKLFSGVNSSSLNLGGIWFELKQPPMLTDKLVDIVIRVRHPLPGWLVVASKGNSSLPYLVVKNVYAPGLTVKRGSAGDWYVDARSTKKLGYSILLRCTVPVLKKPQMALISADVADDKHVYMDLTRGIAIGSNITTPIPFQPPAKIQKPLKRVH